MRKALKIPKQFSRELMSPLMQEDLKRWEDYSLCLYRIDPATWFPKWFRKRILDAVAEMIKADRSDAATILLMAGVDGLAGYRFPLQENIGVRFRVFIEKYFPNGNRDDSSLLWRIRNFVVHDLNTETVLWTRKGLTKYSPDALHDDLAGASKRYFEELQSNPEVYWAFARRWMNIENEKFNPPNEDQEDLLR